jgi:hypothetical protein
LERWEFMGLFFESEDDGLGIVGDGTELIDDGGGGATVGAWAEGVIEEVGKAVEFRAKVMDEEDGSDDLWVRDISGIGEAMCGLDIVGGHRSLASSHWAPALRVLSPY